jgi:nucleoid DNA-binding protein
MTKHGIAKILQDEQGLSQAASIEAVQRVFDCVATTLSTGRKVEIRNFGTFEPRLHKSRRARNPLTGEGVTVPARMAIKFKPGKELKGKLESLTPAISRT